jgi:hypothetical protein
VVAEEAEMSIKVITLCGSTRFKSEFKYWNRELSLHGHLIFNLAAYPSDVGGKDWYDREQKIALDVGYFNKIARSDVIVVMDREGYTGESTAREIEYARSNDVPVYYIEGVPNARDLLR